MNNGSDITKETVKSHFETESNLTKERTEEQKTNGKAKRQKFNYAGRGENQNGGANHDPGSENLLSQYLGYACEE